MAQPNIGTNNIPDPSPGVTDGLWKILIYGLLLIIVGALVAAFVLSSDSKDAATDPAPFFTVATAGLTGILGLFVNPKSDSKTT
jgi:FtsH-binding integral membrane protein